MDSQATANDSVVKLSGSNQHSPQSISNLFDRRLCNIREFYEANQYAGRNRGQK